MYLAGDSAHDMRLITGEMEIGTWENEHGDTLCIHLDHERAEETIRKIQELLRMNQESGQHVELIPAHDENWLHANRHRMFPHML